jgi:pyruvate/2-oxoacid:ferredoxin oxidoreductase beta subunit
MIGILAAHGIPYAATATVAYPVDLLQKVARAKALQGTRFMHILSPCPPGWKYADEDSIELSRLAVRSRVFPLYEVEDGERWRLTVDEPVEPVDEYLKRQGRFRHLEPEQVARIQSDVDARWERLRLV